MRRFHTAGLIVAFLVFLVGAFFSVGPNDVRTLGNTLIIAAAIFAGCVVIGASLILGQTGGPR